MKSNLARISILLAALVLPIHSARAQAPGNTVDALEVARSAYKSDRQAVLAEALQLTEAESVAFWPLYRSYRADMEKLGDGLLKLVLEYADVYPDVSEERARRLLKDYTALEEKLVTTRSWYLKRAARTLSSAKVLRWAQLENRMDLVLRLQLAGTVPLAPAPKAKP